MSRYIILVTICFLVITYSAMAIPLSLNPSGNPPSFSDVISHVGTGSGAGAGTGNAGPGRDSILHEINARNGGKKSPNGGIGRPNKNPVEGYNIYSASRVAGISSAQNGGVGTGTGTGTANLNLFTGQAGATGQGSGSSVGK